MVLPVKGAGVCFAQAVADRRPDSETACVACKGAVCIQNACVYGNIVHKNCFCGKVLRCAVGQRTVYKGGKPIKIACVLDLIYAVYQFGRLILAAHSAESVFISMVGIIRFFCVFIRRRYRLAGINATTGICYITIYCAVGIIKDGVSVCTECLIPALCTVGYIIVQNESDFAACKFLCGFALGI